MLNARVRQEVASSRVPPPTRERGNFDSEVESGLMGVRGSQLGADEYDQKNRQEPKTTALEALNEDTVEQEQEEFSAKIECSTVNWMRKRYIGLSTRDCEMVELVSSGPHMERKESKWRRLGIG